MSSLSLCDAANSASARCLLYTEIASDCSLVAVPLSMRYGSDKKKLVKNAIDLTLHHDIMPPNVSHITSKGGRREIAE